MFLSQMASNTNDVFIDESSQTQNRYLVIGAVVLPVAETAKATEGVLACRRPELNEFGELKWIKVSTTKSAAYRRVIEAFFRNPSLRPLEFHSVVIDTSRLNHRKFNQGDREIGFSKEIFQLCRKIGRLYPGTFHIYLDKRETTETPEKVRLILNRSAKRDGDKRDWPFRRMQFRNSKSVPLLQLVDIFCGAIAYALNGHAQAPNASPAKSAMSAFVLAQAHITNPFADTARKGKFTIWHRQLK
jgi:hypothetical protein